MQSHQHKHLLSQVVYHETKILRDLTYTISSRQKLLNKILNAVLPDYRVDTQPVVDKLFFNRDRQEIFQAC
jgi:hypothetical protein